MYEVASHHQEELFALNLENFQSIILQSFSLQSFKEIKSTIQHWIMATVIDNSEIKN